MTNGRAERDKLDLVEAWERSSDELLVFPGDPGLYDVMQPDGLSDWNLRLDEVRELGHRHGWRIVEV